MKINVYPADEGGCGCYRVRWPAEALANQGADIEIIGAAEPEHKQLMATMYDAGDGGPRQVVKVDIPPADVVVLQRPLTDVLAQSIPHLQAKGIAVVVEIDDDFDALNPRNVSWSVVHPTTSPRRNWRWLRQACEAADLVVTSTPALAARYGRHGRVAVVRNRVPAWYLGVEADPHADVFVGWTGSIATHPGDLEVARGQIGRAVAAAGARFGVVGTGKGVAKALGLREQPVASGWLHLPAYPTAVAELDVGVVPLALTPFNHAKSALKMMEMAAVGVAVIGSPTDENRMIADAGVGVLADSPKAWYRHVHALAIDAERRADLAGRGREAMRSWTIEAHADEWWAAWASARNTVVDRRVTVTA